MKKLLIFIILIIIVSLCFCLIACNRQVIDVNYKFTNAYVKIGESWIDIEIKKWSDYEGEQIQLVLLDNTVLVVSSVNCILYNGTLPKGE